MIDKTKILLVYRLLIILGITLVIASVYFLVAGSGFGWDIAWDAKPFRSFYYKYFIIHANRNDFSWISSS